MSTFTKYMDLSLFQLVALIVFTLIYLLMLLWIFRSGSKLFYNGLANRILGEASGEILKDAAGEVNNEQRK